MPSIADSLERAGYLKPLQDGIKRLMKKSEEDENQDQFNKLMQTAMDSLRKTIAGESDTTPTWKSNIAPPETTLGKNFAPPPSDKMDMSDDPGNITGEKIKRIPPERKQTTGLNPKDQERMRQDQIYADFMNKAGNLKGIDQTKLGNALNTLKMQGSALTPADRKPNELKSFNSTDDIFEIDSETGEISLRRPGIEKQSWKSFGSYTGEDGFEYTKIMGNDGVMKEIKSDKKVKPPKGTVINFKPPKSEKWNGFGGYINSIEYKEDANGMLVPNTPEERKIARELAKNQAIGTMLPRAVNWYNSEVKQKWGVENISMADFEKEIQESYAAGELSAEEAQDLLDMNQYRPFLFDMLRDSARDVEGVEE